MTCACQARLRADRAVIERLTVARPGVDTAEIWRYFTTSVYENGDLPVLAAREALQNALDAIRAAVRARQLKTGEGRFAVTWDPHLRALTLEDNGVGMDQDTLVNKFFYLGRSGKKAAGDSSEAAGGFGVAKAVILGASASFTWQLETRDLRASSRGWGEDITIEESPFRQGVRLQIADVDAEFDTRWDYAQNRYVPLLERLRLMLAANDLEISLTLNGAPVAPLFARRGGGRVQLDTSWGAGTTARVKAYRRAPGDTQGAYYVRLGGLYQFTASQVRGQLKADIVIDLTTTLRPGEAGYPLKASRDGFQGSAVFAFRDLVAEVERESESTGRNVDDEIYEPGGNGGQELIAAGREALADPKVQRALAGAHGAVERYLVELGHSASLPERESSAPAGRRADQDGNGPTAFGPLLAALGGGQVPLPTSDNPPAVATATRRWLEAAERAQAAEGDWSGPRLLTDDVSSALEAVAEGVETAADVALLSAALDQASATVERTGGLLAVAQASRIGALLEEATGVATHVSPFGQSAGLRISRTRYPRARGVAFKKTGYSKAIPLLLLWDGVLRLIAAQARMRVRFAPGFVLDDDVIAQVAREASGTNVVYIHPDRLAEVVKAFRAQPLALAYWLHSTAVHELTHLDGRMGEGHSESFVAHRERLGEATAALLPAIAALATRLLGLPELHAEQREQVARLERALERAKGALREKDLERRHQNRELKRLYQELEGLRTAVASRDGHETPGTEFRWATLAEWLAAWDALRKRRVRAGHYQAMAAHLDALPDDLVEQAGTDLAALEAVLQAVRPQKGHRAGHPSVRLTDALDRTRARIKRDPAIQVVDRLQAVLMSDPPANWTTEEVGEFFGRQRGVLLVLVRRGLAPRLGENL